MRRIRMTPISVIDVCFRWVFWIIPALMDAKSSKNEKYRGIMTFFSSVGVIAIIVMLILFYIGNKASVACIFAYIILGVISHFTTKLKYRQSYLF